MTNARAEPSLDAQVLVTMGRGPSLPPVHTDVTDLRELPSLQEAWDELFRASDCEPSTSFEWTSGLLRHLVGPEDQTLLVTAWRDGRLVALLPLVARPGRLFRRKVVTLSPLSERCATHSDILAPNLDDAIVDGLVERLLRLDLQWECFRMMKLSEDSTLTGGLVRCFEQRRLTYDMSDHSPEYFLSLPGTFDEYLKDRSPKFRNYLRRVERRLSSRGKVRIVEITDARAFPSAWEDILRIERTSWKQPHGSSIPQTPWQERFYREMWMGALERGRLDLQFLTLDGLPVAYNLGYVHGGRYSYLTTSYDHTYRYESSATVLRARLIERLIAGGVTAFDFPGPLFEWERQWTSSVRWYKELWLYNRTPVARMMASMQRWNRQAPPGRGLKHIDPRDRL